MATTFAQEAKRIKNKHYKLRKPGDDKLTDDAFNAEMQQLMMLQEQSKPQESDIAISDNQFANGGGLPKYDSTGPYSSFLPMNRMTPRGFNGQTFNPNIVAPNQNKYSIDELINLDSNAMTDDFMNNIDIPDIEKSIKPYNYSPVASIAGPLISVAGDAVSTGLKAKAAKDYADANKRRKSEMLANLGNINLGRVNAQQIDLGRERQNIKANQSTSEATGRALAKDARSASEIARISNLGRLASQRQAGDLLSRSYSTEESKNAELRARADETNRQLGAQEQQMNNAYKMQIEQMYGEQPDVRPELWGNFAKATAGSTQNYLAENQRMQEYYDFMKVSNPNMDLNYDIPSGLSKWEKRAYQLGLIKPKRQINVRK